MANIEAYIDFAESEDIEEEVPNEVRKSVQDLLVEMNKMLKDAKAGERLRKGVQVAIVGKPNVGKSTLLNKIGKCLKLSDTTFFYFGYFFSVQRPAAIVSPLAGTTRDIVETRIDLDGYPIIIFDTAGKI